MFFCNIIASELSVDYFNLNLKVTMHITNKNAFLNSFDLNFRSYEVMEKEVSTILGFRWYALNDKQFKQTTINVTAAYYFDGYEDQTPST